MFELWIGEMPSEGSAIGTISKELVERSLRLMTCQRGKSSNFIFLVIKENGVQFYNFFLLLV